MIVVCETVSDNFVHPAGQDPEKQFTPKFAAELCSSLEPIGIGATTLSELLQHTFIQFASFPALHEEMRVTYVLQPRQEDGCQTRTSRSSLTKASQEVVVGTEMVAYDGEWLDECINYALGFWLGVRESSAVSWDERFKCGYCCYSDTCNRKPSAPLQHYQHPVLLEKVPNRATDSDFDDMDDIFASLPDELLS